MINLFYSENDWAHTGGRLSGPQKVVENLIRSLKDFDIKYAVNEEVYEKNFLIAWNYSTYKSLQNKESLLIGPQFWPWGRDVLSLGVYNKIICPSNTTKKIYTEFFPDLKVSVWPVGIYPPNIVDNIKFDCLVYYKNRDQNDLQMTLEFLEKRNISYTGLEYGNYSQEEFKESLSEVKYCVIVDNTESQGIALQEMMSVGRPLFVWNHTEGTRTDYMGNNYEIKATTIPYWSDECGEYVNDFAEFETKFDIFLSKLNEYQPQKFIERELSPQRSIEILLELFEND
jgi:hypothetical protein